MLFAEPEQAPPALGNNPDARPELDVFEGPEKKLEVFFTLPDDSSPGFRSFGKEDWTPLLKDAACTILHVQPSEHFDAYLLSESSLFVYPSRVILKTCGTTTLILVLPKLLALADKLGATLLHAHYSHFRYKFPELQLYPHTSFCAEQQCLSKLLEGHISAVHSRVLGPPSGHCWYALCTEPPAPPASPSLDGPTPKPLARASELDDLFEVAMEGLAPDVCALFHEDSDLHHGLTGRKLAQSMTRLSGIGGLVAGATVDDWAFEPCGYSMNACRGRYYYTVHITPEVDFSYASFETNDPAFRDDAKVAAVLAVFCPSTATLTLTTRRSEVTLPEYVIDGFERASYEHTLLAPAVSVCCANFVSAALGAPAASLGGDAKRKAADVEGGDEGGSEASSEDTWEWSEKESEKWSEKESEKEELISPITSTMTPMCAAR
jgi:S-adenosylmethionine decarboxylase